jgi:hypothetical protein
MHGSDIWSINFQTINNLTLLSRTTPIPNQPIYKQTKQFYFLKFERKLYEINFF